MAGTLLDAIQGNLQNSTPAGGGGVADDTAKAQQLLAAKSGKAGAGGPQSSTPATSNLGEQSAANQTRAGLTQLDTQGKIASSGVAQQQAGLTQEATIQEKQAAADRAQVQGQYSNQASQILGTLERGKQTLDADQQKAGLEQAGFYTRLSNDQYVTQLNAEADRKQIDQEANFKTELAKQTFADQESLFKDESDYKVLAQMTQDQFRQSLANMDIDFAINMAKTEADAANRAGMAAGAGSVIGAGAQAYANSGSKTTAPTPAPAATESTAPTEGVS